MQPPSLLPNLMLPLIIKNKARQFGRRQFDGTNSSATRFVSKSICQRANLTVSQLGGKISKNNLLLQALK